MARPANTYRAARRIVSRLNGTPFRKLSGHDLTKPFKASDGYRPRLVSLTERVRLLAHPLAA